MGARPLNHRRTRRSARGVRVTPSPAPLRAAADATRHGGTARPRARSPAARRRSCCRDRTVDRSSVLIHGDPGRLHLGHGRHRLNGLAAAAAEDVELHVWVTETRPYLEGARLATWELRQRGHRAHRCSADSAVGIPAGRRADRCGAAGRRLDRRQRRTPVVGSRAGGAAVAGPVPALHAPHEHASPMPGRQRLAPHPSRRATWALPDGYGTTAGYNPAADACQRGGSRRSDRDGRPVAGRRRDGASSPTDARLGAIVPEPAVQPRPPCQATPVPASAD